MALRTPSQPPLAHRILWTLEDTLETVRLLHSIRGWMLRDWIRERTRRQRETTSGHARREAVRQSIAYLQRAAYIITEGSGRAKVWRLTAKGRMLALVTAARLLGKRRSPTTQRGRWLVIFDIPEEQRRQRTLLRRVLYGLKGKFLQRSAFLLGDREAFVLLRHIVKTARLRPYVRIIEVRRFVR